MNDSGLITAAEPITNAVTDHSASNRISEYPPKSQGSGSHESTGDEDRGATWDEGADNGDSLQECREENHRERCYRMSGEQMQQLEIRILHQHLQRFTRHMSASDSVWGRFRLSLNANVEAIAMMAEFRKVAALRRRPRMVSEFLRLVDGLEGFDAFRRTRVLRCWGIGVTPVATRILLIIMLQYGAYFFYR